MWLVYAINSSEFIRTHTFAKCKNKKQNKCWAGQEQGPAKKKKTFLYDFSDKKNARKTFVSEIRQKTPIFVFQKIGFTTRSNTCIRPRNTLKVPYNDIFLWTSTSRS